MTTISRLESISSSLFKTGQDECPLRAVDHQLKLSSSSFNTILVLDAIFFKAKENEARNMFHSLGYFKLPKNPGRDAASVTKNSLLYIALLLYANV